LPYGTILYSKRSQKKMGNQTGKACLVVTDLLTD
jgi:hypothetical protein